MKTSLVTLAALALAGAAFATAPVDPTRPMVTGRGNVAARPGKVIVTNQTAPEAAKADESIKLEKFVVTGSLLKKADARRLLRR